MYGHNVSHAKNRTRRIFKPNLHSARILVRGVYKRVKLCTSCLRMYKGKTSKAKKVELVPQVPTVAVS